MWRWSAAILLLGFVVRIAVVASKYPADLERPEPVNIAISLATTGQYADAYGVGSGPTAHTAPLHPLILSAIIRVFGTGAAGALAISVVASMMSALAFAMLPLLAIASGVGLRAGAVAGVAGAIFPVNFWAQTSGTFDAPFTAAALVLLCILVSKIWAGQSFTAVAGARFGTAAGVAALLNPALIQVLLAWTILSFALFRRCLRRVVVFISIGVLSFLVVFLPWASRNHRVLGSWIWTRSNFGLEFWLSNNSVLTSDEERNLRMPEFYDLHPFSSPKGRAEVRRVGEVAYSRAKLDDALEWIKSHKSAFVLRTADHFRLFWAPRMLRPWQSLFELALTIAGFCGLARLFRERGVEVWTFAGTLAGYPLVYYLIQESPRYRFPVEPILLLLAAPLAVGPDAAKPKIAEPRVSKQGSKTRVFA